MKQETTSEKAFQEDIKTLIPFFSLEGHKPLEFFTGTYMDTLAREAEFSFAPYKNQMEITIQDRGEKFHQKIEELFTYLHLPRESLNSYREINNLFPDTGTLLKTDFAEDMDSSVSLYYQTQVSVRLTSRIHRMLTGTGIPQQDLLAMGRLLGRKGVYIGMDFKKDSLPGLAIFYPLPPRKAKITENFVQAMTHLKLEERQKSLLKNHHNDLTSLIKGDLFVSFALIGNELDAMKTDYELITIPATIKILKEAAIDDEQILRLIKISRALDTPVLSYLGIRYFKNNSITFKFYFKRVYSGNQNDEMEKIAHFLESSIWRFGQ